MTSSTAPGWLRAGGLSFALHGLIVAAIGLGAWRARGHEPAAVDPAPMALPLIDLALADEPLPAGLPPLVPAPPPGDATSARVSSPAPAAPGVEGHQVPALDSGLGAGRRAADTAWRRDRSTLHDRLTNGRDRNRPAHSRTAARAASPQADRREEATGPGDAPRADRAAGAPAVSLAMQDPDAIPRGDEVGAPGAPGEAAEGAVAPGAPGTITRSGPLDTTRGSRAFDVQRRGAAADNRAMAAASAELHPSVTDLSAPAVPGPGNEGHGMAARRGVAPPAPVRAAAAPSRPGHLGPLAGAGEGSAGDRAHARYETEIRGRVARALIFPRSLAIRLLLGETMLSFAVAPDGHVDGPILVTKSAGYDEFDRAAVDAVRRAAPFPPLPLEVARQAREGRSFALRVTFSNPVIR